MQIKKTKKRRHLFKKANTQTKANNKILQKKRKETKAQILKQQQKHEPKIRKAPKK